MDNFGPLDTGRGQLSHISCLLALFFCIFFVLPLTFDFVIISPALEETHYRSRKDCDCVRRPLPFLTFDPPLSLWDSLGLTFASEASLL